MLSFLFCKVIKCLFSPGMGCPATRILVKIDLFFLLLYGKTDNLFKRLKIYDLLRLIKFSFGLILWENYLDVKKYYIRLFSPNCSKNIIESLLLRITSHCFLIGCKRAALSVEGR